MSFGGKSGKRSTEVRSSSLPPVTDGPAGPAESVSSAPERELGGVDADGCDGEVRPWSNGSFRSALRHLPSLECPVSR